MAKIAFIKKSFRNDSLELIGQANEVLDSYAAKGLRLTLRQLYYQLVSHHGLGNIQSNYKRLSAVISDARLAGLVDWSVIEDRIRQPYRHPEFDGIPDLMEAAIRSYRLPRWIGQKHYVEIWCEKDALAGVLRPLTDEFHVVQIVNRGYCVDPDVRILTADLMWVPAKNILPGQEVFGVDEVVPGPKKHRKLRLTIVKSVQSFISPRIRVFTDKGSIVVSNNHPFLSTVKRENRGYLWTNASKLKPGAVIGWLGKPWESDNSWEGGWLSGMLDGEGCLPMTRLNLQLSIYQKPGPVADHIREVLKSRGFFGTETTKENQVTSFRVYGVENVMTLLGSVRPIRLMNNFRNLVRRRGGPSKSKTPATVLFIEQLSDGPVIGLETGSRTIITDGFVSHNSSQSAMYEGSVRIGSRGKGKKKTVLYIGDHDPSGEDMVRDIAERLDVFGMGHADVRKIALTMEQVKEYDLPPNPANMRDSRAERYVEEHGEASWEVDALPPEVLQDLVRSSIEKLLDRKAMNKVIRREEADKKEIREWSEERRLS